MLNEKRSAWLGLILAVALAPSALAAKRLPPPQNPGVPQTLHVLVNRAMLLNFPVPITRIAIVNPNIAASVVISTTQVLLEGEAPGATSMVVWGSNNETETFEVYVDVDVVALSDKIHEVFPSEHVNIEASKDVVMLTGQASSADVADRIYTLVHAEVPNVISLVQVPTAPTEGQIRLDCKIAELDLTKAKSEGFNVFALPTGVTKTLGVLQTQQFGPVSSSGISSGSGGGSSSSVTLQSILNLFIFRPDIGMGITLEALQNSSLLQILSEPSLLTETGKEANFLAGGQFPFPVVQGGGAGSVPTVSIEFKQFGVMLHFTPTLTADGQIDLKVEPEVSTLDYTNALAFEGFIIPAISTRRVQSEMLLRDGESFAIAGLLDHRVTQVMDKIPWIGDVPILGKLFQSSNLQKSNEELLVLVTPHIVKPYGPGQAPAGPKFPVQFMTWPPPPSALKPGSKF